MERRTAANGVRRRQVLRSATVLAGGGAAVNLARPAAASGNDLVSWFSNVGNYDGLVDRRDSSDVTVTVGASGSGGSMAFSPAAVHLDQETTVVWEWTGNGGSHDVTAEDGSFGSDLLSEAGATFEHTVDTARTTRYACTPHRAMGMKRAVVVGDIFEGIYREIGRVPRGLTPRVKAVTIFNKFNYLQVLYINNDQKKPIKVWN